MRSLNTRFQKEKKSKNNFNNYLLSKSSKSIRHIKNNNFFYVLYPKEIRNDLLFRD